MNKKILIIALVAVFVIGAGVVITFGQINKKTGSQKDIRGETQ